MGSDRHLLVVRHAKSDWSLPAADIDRPLNARGRRDAPAIGRWVADQRLPVDAAVISPSARTRATWQLLAEAAGLDVAPGLDRGIYLGEAADLAEAVGTLPEAARCAVLVGHAPGCEEFVEWAAAGRGDPVALEAMRAKYPTAAVALLDIAGEWSALGPGSAALAAFAVCRG